MNKEHLPRAHGYIRVSTEEQIGGASLRVQQNAIESYAKNNGFELVDIFRDEGISAKTASRPALQDMLTRLASRDNDIEAVIVYNLSRISRNVGSFYRDIGYTLASRGVTLYSTQENIDETPQGKLMRNLALSIHQFDNDVKSKTIKDNMRFVANEGWWQCKIPYGYKRSRVLIGEYTNDGKRKERLTLTPDTGNGLSEKIKMLLERFSIGDIKQLELADYAESIGLKSANGGRFAPQSIKNMLTAPVYAGYICNSMTDFEMIRGKHEGIISLDTYNRNQAILEGRLPSIPTPRFTVDYPLKHSLLCVSCHKTLTGSAPTCGSGKRSPRYHCTRCKGMGSIGVVEMEHLFNQFLLEVTPTDGAIKMFKIIVKRIAKEKLRSLNSDISIAREEISKIDSDIHKALQKFIDGDLSKEEKDSYQQGLRLKRIDLELKLDNLMDSQRLNESTIDYVCNFIKVPSKMWQDADNETKINFQKLVIPNGVEFDIREKKFGTSGLSPLYRLKDIIKDSSMKDESLMVILPGIEPGLPG